MEPGELIRLVKQGDKPAAATLVSTLGTELDAYCARITPSDFGTADREDAVDAALQRVVAQINKYDPSIASLSTWARAFVRHEVDEMRRGVREIAASGTGLLAGNAAPHSLGDDPAAYDDDASAMSDAERSVLGLVLLVLADDERALLYARSNERLSYEDLATNLKDEEGNGPTAAALRKRYQRILTKLRDAAAGDPVLCSYLEEATDE